MNLAEGDYEASGRNTAVLGFALLLIGFAAGAIAAALMTPKTGKQMRRELKRKAGDLRERVEDWSEQAGDWVEKGSDLAGKAGTGPLPPKSVSSRWPRSSAASPDDEPAATKNGAAIGSASYLRCFTKKPKSTLPHRKANLS